RRIVYNATNCAVRLQWHQTSNAELINLSGYGEYCLEDIQGIVNPKGTGSTGDIDLLVYPFAAVTAGAGIVTEMFSMTIECVKGA
ncbi:MAG: hypothetical protein KGL39_30920, partial [Patescibacteria group bacterium]|nr:hypothetical protein [Patescibacteria group bacterium]